MNRNRVTLPRNMIPVLLRQKYNRNSSLHYRFRIWMLSVENSPLVLAVEVNLNYFPSSRRRCRYRVRMATVNYNSPDARVGANFQRDGKNQKICGDSKLIYFVDDEQANTRTTSKRCRIEIEDVQTDTSILNLVCARPKTLYSRR